MQRAQQAFASASHHGLAEESANALRAATGAIDKAFLGQQERIKDGLFRDRRDLSVCYTKGWFGWGKSRCPDGLPPPWKEGDPIRNASPRAADPRYAQGGRRKTRGKKSKKFKKSKKTRRY